MLASISDLLSCLPPLLPLPTKKDPTLLPPTPLILSCRNPSFRREDGGGYLPLSINGDHNLRPEPVEILRSCSPGAAWARALWFKAGNYNVQVVVGEDESEESLLRRFKREVMKAGVIQDCKRRRWFEDKQARKKSKARAAAQRNRKRRFQPWKPPPDKQEASKREKEEEEDNWELPEGELPY